MKVNLLVIRSAKPKSLSEFYSILGLQFEYHQHGNGPIHYSADVNGLIFEIYPLLRNQKEADISTRLGFEVEDLNQIIQKIKNAGHEIVAEPKQMEWGFVAIVKDLEGRKIELKQI